jgi:hypothetical protein
MADFSDRDYPRLVPIDVRRSQKDSAGEKYFDTCLPGMAVQTPGMPEVDGGDTLSLSID